MKQGHEKRCSWQLMAGAVLSLMASGTVLGQSSVAWHAEAESVHELMRLERERVARDLSQSKQAPVPQAQVRAEPQASSVQLQALYGVEGALTAIVSINGVRKEYRTGSALPLGGASAADHRLRGIANGCVLLQRRAEPVQRACYRPAVEVPSESALTHGVLSAALPETP